jgi:hypothetical protein
MVHTPLILGNRAKYLQREDYSNLPAKGLNAQLSKGSDVTVTLSVKTLLTVITV